MKRRNKTMALLAMCMVCMCGCSNESEEDSVDNKLVELAVNPSIMQVRAERGVQTETAGSALGSIAVYANSAKTNDATNNYAVYTYSDSKWAAGTDNKIYLSNEDATIYASYPTGKVAAHDAAVTANSVVEISTLAGATDADDNNTITITGDNNTSATNACAGEVDYMYAEPVENIDNESKKVELKMKHAMSMVSFRVYKDASYTNSGQLTKIVLNNADGASVLLKPGTSQTATMKLGDGTVTVNGGVAATYTRFTQSGSENYYTLKEVANPESVATTVPAFSILVYPIKTAFEAEKVQATFTIDGKNYPITLPAQSVTDNYAWAPGKNYVYSVTMNGKELSVTSVALTDWVTETINGNIDLVTKK